MKRNLIFLIPFLFLIFSCGSGDEPKPEPPGPVNPNPDKPPVVVDFLDLSLTTINFTNQKDASLVVVKTNLNWTVTKNADWILLSATSGNKNTGFLIGAPTNDGFFREAIVTIKAGDKSKEIKVTQDKATKITVTVKGVSFNMILAEGGEFTMGSSEQTIYGIPHKVKLSDFYISENEATNALWHAVMNKLPYKEHSETGKPNLPVSETIWTDITTGFIPALNTASGKTFRLPTEAEWEYAAMGGKKSKGFKYAGSDVLDDVAWINISEKGAKNTVKSKLPNELGLYDMSGNVSEWCSDWYGDHYDFKIENGSIVIPDLQTDPKGPETGEKKVVRGGSFTDNEYWGNSACHVKYRYSIKPSGYDGAWGNTGDPREPQQFLSKNTGFRLVLTN